jgi:hypothetical protein
MEILNQQQKWTGCTLEDGEETASFQAAERFQNSMKMTDTNWYRKQKSVKMFSWNVED